jgi:hypothetical protein
MQFMGKCFSELWKAEDDFAEDNENLITNFIITHLENLSEICHIYR